MRVLIDTCVISELQRKQIDPRVQKVLRSIPRDEAFLSVITIGELMSGSARLPYGKRRSDLEVWIAELEHMYAPRILPVDLETGRIWGEITGKAAISGTTIPIADGLIAATALRHGMHVMTRNSNDFAVAGVLVWDPWQG